MKAFLSFIILIAALAFLSVQHTWADPAKPNQYAVKLTLTETTNGHPKLISSPELAVDTDREASFLAGGSIKIIDDKVDVLNVGVQARVKIHELANNQLRVIIYAGLSEVGTEKITVHDQGTHIVKTIKPGDKIDFDFAPGYHAAMTITVE